MLKQFTAEEAYAAYLETGNVHKAGEMIGVSGQRVHYALKKAGYQLRQYTYSAEEKAAIEAYYRDTPDTEFDLGAFAEQLGRPAGNISRYARTVGLTRKSRPCKEHIKKRMGEAVRRAWQEKGHPKGATGLKHSDEAKAVIGEKSKLAWLTAKTFGIGRYSEEARQKSSDRMSERMNSRPNENPYSRAKGGVRPDIGPMYFRSKWEANYARYLMWLQARGDIDGWEYEPQTFWFEAIKRGVRSYKPDFLVKEKGTEYFVEVKGWLDPKSKTKLARMKRYYPTVKVKLFGERDYASLRGKLSRVIPGWEP